MDEFDDSSDLSSKPLHPRHSDLESLCARQHDEIDSLKSLLQAKDRELESLNRVLQKYATIIPELRTLRKSPGVESTMQKSGGDFWESHEEAQVNFEEIASKGLWIMSSAQQTNAPTGLARLGGYRDRVDRRKADSVPLETKEEKQGRKALKLGELIRPAGPVRGFVQRNTDVPLQASGVRKTFPTKVPLRPKDPQPPTHRKANSLLSRLRQ